MSKPRTLPPTPQQIDEALFVWLKGRNEGFNDMGVALSGYTYARLRRWAAERGIEVPPMTRGKKKSGNAITDIHSTKKSTP